MEHLMTFFGTLIGKHCSRPVFRILHFVDSASRYKRVKKNQLDAQLILSIFHQPLHVSVISRPFIGR